MTEQRSLGTTANRLDQHARGSVKSVALIATFNDALTGYTGDGRDARNSSTVDTSGSARKGIDTATACHQPDSEEMHQSKPMANDNADDSHDSISESVSTHS
jgi:hypothetical protein